MTYEIIYSTESIDDLRAIYMYIAYEKLAPQNAEGQFFIFISNAELKHL